jgi:hypothetical protein
MKYTIRQGLDVAKGYSTADALRALPDYVFIFLALSPTDDANFPLFNLGAVTKKNGSWVNDAKGWCDADNARLAERIANPRLMAFTIIIPEAE